MIMPSMNPDFSFATTALIPTSAIARTPVNNRPDFHPCLITYLDPPLMLILTVAQAPFLMKILPMVPMAI